MKRWIDMKIGKTKAQNYKENSFGEQQTGLNLFFAWKTQCFLFQLEARCYMHAT